jgi:hypothetical protein
MSQLDWSGQSGRFKVTPKKSVKRRATPALKFHNFVANHHSPNDSNANACASGSGSSAHCLKEEHGSKQITVSHWHHVESNAAVIAARPRKSESVQPEDGSPTRTKRRKSDSPTEAPTVIRSAEPFVSNRNTLSSGQQPFPYDTKDACRSNLFTFDPITSHVQSEPLDLSIKKSINTSQSFSIELTQSPFQTSQSDHDKRHFRSVVDGLKAQSNGSCAFPPSPDMPCNSSHSTSTASLAPAKVTRSRLDRKAKQSTNPLNGNRIVPEVNRNGFLIKTKQVTDGEATFCKFRKLTKYTKYYFKNHQNQTLPDEMSKLWKGFLPPKNGRSADPNINL